MTEQKPTLPHKLVLNERESLAISGVTEVVRFDEDSIVLHTSLGTLVVHGSNLQLKTLSPEGGNVTVLGDICALSYEEPRAGGWLNRFFR